MKLLSNIYSVRFIKGLSIFEFFFYSYLIYDRTQIIIGLLKINKGLREIIEFDRYEYGWNFIFLILLFLSLILTYYKKRIAWTLKLIGLICIFLTLFWEKSLYSVVVIILLIYFSLDKTILNFEILMTEKLKFYGIVIFFVTLFFIASNWYYFIKY